MGVDPNVSRRTFLTWYMAGLMTATLVAGVAPILVYIWPPAPPGQKAGKVKVDPKTPLTQLAENDAERFDAPQDAGFFMQDGGGDNAKGDIAYSGYAVKTAGQTLFFAVNCSHLGCSINWVKDKTRFECPCHGSRFSIDGKVIHGPAMFPLSHLKVEPQPDGSLQVDGFTQTVGAS
jgi:Rieske Fe-S protein